MDTIQDTMAAKECYDVRNDYVRLLNTVLEMKNNVNRVSAEWNGLKKSNIFQQQEHSYIVSQNGIERLQKEVRMFKQFLPRVLSGDVTEMMRTAIQSGNELRMVQADLDKVKAERTHWEARCGATREQYEAEKQERLQAQAELDEVTENLSNQTDYCSNMGSICCTILWRISSCEDTIRTIIAGSKMDDFLSLVFGTLESFMLTYKNDWPTEPSEEVDFILAMAGIITNIAASAYGRDFLMTNDGGKKVIGAFIEVLNEAPNKGECSKLKNLVLMCVYNISINQKGLKYITSSRGLISVLVWILQDEKAVENRTHSIRVLQSLLFDDSSSENVHLVHEVNEAQCECVLQGLLTDRHSSIREAAKELLDDLSLMKAEH